MSNVEQNPIEGPTIRLGISTCLLGEQVRYDGGHKLDRYLTGTLGQFFEWVPVCPEVEIGLPTPRESMRLVGERRKSALIAPKSGTDYTEPNESLGTRAPGGIGGHGLVRLCGQRRTRRLPGFSA